MPEFIKKSERRARNKWEKRYYFCHVGRTGGRSILWNLVQDGYKIIHEEKPRPTRDEIFELYSSKKGIDKIMPKEVISIVRHPMARIESHLRWANHVNKFSGQKNECFDFIDYSLDNIYEDELGRHLIPAFETVLFDATVLQYEIGFRKIAEFFVQEKIVDRWKRNIRIKENGKSRIIWENCPQALKEKILRIYEKDFEVFDYDPDTYFKE